MYGEKNKLAARSALEQWISKIFNRNTTVQLVYKWNRKGPFILLHLSGFSVEKVSLRWVSWKNIPLLEVFQKN